jgi:dTDP-glucose 4,6-dehydratase
VEIRSYFVAGGAGFIGSNFVRLVLETHPDCKVIVYDKLTYAGNRANLADLLDDPRLTFVKGDVCDRFLVDREMRGCDVVVNFAAETHVDRSIQAPNAFIQTDIVGTHVLLEVARKYGIKRYIQISTDEVYGSIEEGHFTEDSPLAPSSPYSASKASADLLVRSYWTTYRLPVIVTRSSNNFGPRQHPEKLIPLFITNALEDKSLPLYGDGLNVRDWLYVEDHCRAIDLVIEKGEKGAVYNVAANCEKTNIEITRRILEALGKPESLIRPVTDRPGHDRRYALTAEPLRTLGWAPQAPFEARLQQTVNWYVENRGWWESLKRGEFEEYYRRQYPDLAKADR